MEKPGYKTIGFYLTALATVLGALVASGALAETGAIMNAIGFIIPALATARYSSVRQFEKAGEGEKPSWKTTEFWLTVAFAIVSLLAMTGAFAADSTAGKIIAGAASILAMLGYGARASLPPLPPVK
jgi:hypothetical protein